jgi:hypothetical protein
MTLGSGTLTSDMRLFSDAQEQTKTTPPPAATIAVMIGLAMTSRHHQLRAWAKEYLFVNCNTEVEIGE